MTYLIDKKNPPHQQGKKNKVENKTMLEKVPTESYSNTNKAPEASHHILLHHWDEWIQSGVSSEIINRNVSSILDSRELDRKLNRNNNKRYKHSDSLVPAWAVTGIDPTTGERWLQGIQAKPDNPTEREGKIQKYLGASENGTHPLFLEVEKPDYWQEILQDKSKPIVITEGAKKAGSLLTHGEPTISIPGVSTCRKQGRLHELLSLFAGYGRTFYLCFDNDVLIKKPVQQALMGLARELTATGSKVMVISLPQSDNFKGVDDYLVKHGYDDFLSLKNEALTIEEWSHKVKQQWAATQEFAKSYKNSKLARSIYLIDKAWGEHLAWNELKKCVELNGEELEADSLRVKIAMDLDIDTSKDDAITAIKELAKRRSYHPIREYLKDVAKSHPVDTSVLDNLATIFFGNSSPICNIYMRKMLISAVARAMCPGRKVDTAVILHGGQGVKKSTFWNSLFGDEWFSDSLNDANEKDELMKIHSFWGLEWAEFETVYKKKDVSTLKKFMAQRCDSFRIPYDRGITKHLRPSILVGTTNDKEILQDPTGDRRFWVIDVATTDIDIPKLEEMRDRIWASAYQAWEQGEIWWLNRAEEKMHDENNKDFRVEDPWYQQIFDFLKGKIQTTLTDIFSFLSIEPSRQDVGTAKRIGSVLRFMGWEKRRSSDESRGRVWVKLEKFQNSSGSSGSSGSSISEPLPDMASRDTQNLIHLNQENNSSGSSGSENTEVSYITSKNHDPLENQNIEKNGSSGSESTYTQQEFQPSDPHDPLDPLGDKKSTKNTIKVIYSSPLGEVRAIALPGGQDRGYEIELQIPGMESIVTFTSHTEQKKVLIVAKKVLIKNLKSIKFQIHIITAPPGKYEWVDAEFLDHKPNEYDPRKDKWVFLRNGFEYSIQDLDLIRLKPND